MMNLCGSSDSLLTQRGKTKWHGTRLHVTGNCFILDKVKEGLKPIKKVERSDG
jgi:hypothetical protein